MCIRVQISKLKTYEDEDGYLLENCVIMMATPFATLLSLEKVTIQQKVVVGQADIWSAVAESSKTQKGKNDGHDIQTVVTNLIVESMPACSVTLSCNVLWGIPTPFKIVFSLFGSH